LVGLAGSGWSGVVGQTMKGQPGAQLSYVAGLWRMARAFGLRATSRYERVRRSGTTIEYSALFTPDELAKLGERIDPVPWERRARESDR
jgi:hypothetical protein